MDPRATNEPLTAAIAASKKTAPPPPFSFANIVTKLHQGQEKLAAVHKCSKSRLAAQYRQQQQDAEGGGGSRPASAMSPPVYKATSPTSPATPTTAASATAIVGSGNRIVRSPQPPSAQTVPAATGNVGSFASPKATNITTTTTTTHRAGAPSAMSNLSRDSSMAPVDASGSNADSPSGGGGGVSASMLKKKKKVQAYTDPNKLIASHNISIESSHFDDGTQFDDVFDELADIYAVDVDEHHTAVAARSFLTLDHNINYQGLVVVTWQLLLDFLKTHPAECEEGRHLAFLSVPGCSLEDFVWKIDTFITTEISSTEDRHDWQCTMPPPKGTSAVTLKHATEFNSISPNKRKHRRKAPTPGLGAPTQQSGSRPGSSWSNNPSQVSDNDNQHDFSAHPSFSDENINLVHLAMHEFLQLLAQSLSMHVIAPWSSLALAWRSVIECVLAQMGYCYLHPDLGHVINDIAHWLEIDLIGRPLEDPNSTYADRVTIETTLVYLPVLKSGRVHDPNLFITMSLAALQLSSRRHSFSVQLRKRQKGLSTELGDQLFLALKESALLCTQGHAWNNNPPIVKPMTTDLVDKVSDALQLALAQDVEWSERATLVWKAVIRLLHFAM